MKVAELFRSSIAQPRGASDEDAIMFFINNPLIKCHLLKNSVSIVDMKRHGGWTNSSGNDLILQLWPAHFQ